MNTELLIKLSLIIDKMGIAQAIKNIEKETNEEVGKELMVLFIINLHKAEKEVYDCVISYKELLEEPTIDENIENYEEVYKKEYEKNYKNAVKKAKKYNIVEIIKEILNIEGMKDFL